MKDISVGKWMYNLGGSEIWIGEEFDTKEQAIKFAKKEIEEDDLGVTNFEVGQITEATVSGVDIDLLLENVAENTTCEIGEIGDDYLDDVTKEDREELEESLNEVLFKWIHKHNYEPSFFKIENIENIEL